MVPLDVEWSRDILVGLFSCQRSDGWFPRQYSAEGRTGKHDLRQYADGGIFVLEFLYEYLCFSRDWSLLDEQDASWQTTASKSPGSGLLNKPPVKTVWLIPPTFMSICRVAMFRGFVQG